MTPTTTQKQRFFAACIAAKTDVKSNYETLWTKIVVLNEIAGLSESTMKELREKIRSKIDECDISIREYSQFL